MHVMVLQKSIGVRDLAQNIQRHLAEFQGLKNLKKNESINRSHKTQEGIPRTRIYFDAAFDSRTFSSATGLVGWDLRGNLMVLKTVIHRNVPSPFAAEAYACLEGAKLGSSLRIQSVRFMGYSITVKKMSSNFNRQVSYRSHYQRYSEEESRFSRTYFSVYSQIGEHICSQISKDRARERRNLSEGRRSGRSCFRLGRNLA
ncbi:hypothetical protein Goklo_024700 [Gossypium klotzschianum]|uniref:RNase H type-1 domain-containing protein n=2 Tax=Gossypium TaxID=3633 RepID=A0A7J8WG94_9ROSI|nr:hypothetical protein [Gossypium klotzschianum]